MDTPCAVGMERRWHMSRITQGVFYLFRRRVMRKFDSGATRDDNIGKIDYEGFLSPLVLERYGQYMLKHQVQTDGKVRDSDNWQKGIPRDAYMKSLWRHFVDVWKQHRGLPGQDMLEDSLMAILFNTMGYAHETIMARIKGDGDGV
jgi:hypothetical protein